MILRKLAPAAAAVLVAACGTAASAGSGAKPTPSPQRLRNGAFGQLVKISGSTLVVSGQNGDVTVDFDSSTRVTRTSTAAVADIVPGVCIIATGQKDSAGAVTATFVRLTNPVNGSCAGGNRGPGPVFTPGGFGGRRTAPTPPANFGFAAGLVTAVSGTTVTLQPSGSSAASVTVPTTVSVSRTEAATTADLQIGECITAAGRRDTAGVVQATALTISPPNASRTCTLGAGGGFFRGGGGGGGGGFGGGDGGGGGGFFGGGG